MFLTVSLSIPFATFLQCFPKAVAEAEILVYFMEGSKIMFNLCFQ